MKNTNTFNAVLTLTLIICSGELFGQGFNSIASPDGINIIAAGDSGKIFRSDNSVSNWFSTHEPSVDFKSISFYNGDVWLAGNNGVVYKTLISGSLLSPYNVPGNPVINSVCFVNAGTGYICGNDGTVFKSVNGGVNWTSYSSGISPIKLNSISFKDPDNGVAAGINGIVYITTNGGSTWIQETIPTSKNLLKAKCFADGIAIAGESGTLILKHGALWESVNTNILTDIRGISGSGINDVHVCGGGGFIRNNKNGSTDFLNFESNPMRANLVDIFYSDNNTGFAVSTLTNSIIKTSNGGAAWNLLPGSTMSYVWDIKLNTGGGFGNTLCMHPTDPNTIFVGMGNKIYVSRNKGDNWTYLDSISYLSPFRSLYVSPLDTNIWLAATGGRILKTTNYGTTWTVSIEIDFSTYGQPLEMDQNNPNVFYIAPDGGGFYKSTDIGSTFNQISNFPFDSPCDILVQWDHPEVLLLGDGPTSGSGAKVFKSTNGGVNWTLVLSTASNFHEIPSISNTVFDNDLVFVTEYGPSIYKSTDFGSTFTTSYNSTDYNWASAICLEDPTSVIVGSFSFNGPSILTNNGGANWTNFPSGSNSWESGLIAPDKSYSLAYRGNGVYKLNTHYSGITSVHENIITNNLPDDYILYQNYPNPFNPVTKIKFAVPRSGDVSLVVFDNLGREIITLSDGFKNAGTYEVDYDASALTSGIYYYRLTANNVITTKKMTLIK